MASGGPVAVLGGSGYIGRALTAALAADGVPVRVLTRGGGIKLPPGAEAVTWSPSRGPAGLGEGIVGASAVVNLAGENIGSRRWSYPRRQQLVQSRVATTRLLVSAISGLEHADRPPVLVNASGVDYYGHRDEDAATERDPPGDSFLALLCVGWEAAASEAEQIGVRVVRVRTGLVISRGSPGLRVFERPVLFFAGGTLGTGRQWISWIHLADVVGLYRLAIDDEGLSGPLNAVAPGARRQKDFADLVSRFAHRPRLPPVPRIALRTMMGVQADLALHGRRAAPEVAIRHGYDFRYPTLEDALWEALG